jgi:hypothetical protein
MELAQEVAARPAWRRRASQLAYVASGFCFLAFSLPWAFGTGSLRPGLYVATPHKSISEAEHRSQAKHTVSFEIRNITLSAVKIKVEPSCGCLQPSWSKKRLSPLSSTDMVVTYVPASISRGSTKNIALRVEGQDKFLFVDNLGASRAWAKRAL